MLVGIRPQRMYAVAWGLGTALVAVAGVILANFFSVYPQAGLSFTVLAYAIVALGGFGCILGTLLAALAGRRGAERDRGLPAARVQGRVRLRVLHPDRPVPAPGAVWPLLARRPAPAARSRWSGWSPPSRPCSTRSPSSAAARSTTRRWASWCCSTPCSASAGTSSAAGPGQFDFGPSIFFAIGAYTAALLSIHFGWNAWLALLGGGGGRRWSSARRSPTRSPGCAATTSRSPPWRCG